MNALNSSDTSDTGRTRYSILDELQRAAQSMAPVYAVFRETAESMLPTERGQRQTRMPT